MFVTREDIIRALQKNVNPKPRESGKKTGRVWGGGQGGGRGEEGNDVRVFCIQSFNRVSFAMFNDLFSAPQSQP